ncbi:phenylalanine--tRNA ligase, beta subunit [gut metagenome]|uniref:Phenylalanine--tRNA ligase, beta subunit n=1 Tax=gut metagenome TaxID=749906 RepID=J9G0Z9_9ZZZZ
MNEMMTYSFIKANAFDKMLLAADDARRSCIELLNPITDAFSVMRTTMVPSALQTASFNLRNHNDSVALFEVGRVFIPKALPLNEDPAELPMLTAVISGKCGALNWCSRKDSVDFYDMKGIVEGLLAALQVEDYELVRSTEPYLHPGKSCDIIVKGKVIGSFGEVPSCCSGNFELDLTTYVLECKFCLWLSMQLLFLSIIICLNIRQ